MSSTATPCGSIRRTSSAWTPESSGSWLAEACGNRTHPALLSERHVGFEDRARHQPGSASAEEARNPSMATRGCPLTRGSMTRGRRELALLPLHCPAPTLPTDPALPPSWLRPLPVLPALFSRPWSPIWGIMAHHVRPVPSRSNQFGPPGSYFRTKERGSDPGKGMHG